MNKKEVFWLSPPPTHCDTCGTPITRTFYDMATRMGPWANMCPSCGLLGPGVGQTGPGRGQRYDKQPDGRYKKTAG